jgi:hypothetical protein
MLAEWVIGVVFLVGRAAVGSGGETASSLSGAREDFQGPSCRVLEPLQEREFPLQRRTASRGRAAPQRTLRSDFHSISPFTASVTSARIVNSEATAKQAAY